MALFQLLDGDDWQFSGFVGEAWRGVEDPTRQGERGWNSATVPGTVYHDLLVHGEIPDPYYERNSLFSEWACARHWAYRKHFRVEPELQGKRIRLWLSGIDYSGTFYLNGVELGTHEGMFVPASFDVSHLLRYGDDNFLVIVLDPAPVEQPQVGRTSLVRTHKSRMTYWWDFCPRMIHVGIWDSVWLDATGPVAVDDVYGKPNYVASESIATIFVRSALSTQNACEVTLSTELSQAGKVLETREDTHFISDANPDVTYTVNVTNPLLWWPNGEGDANLYQLTVRATVEGELSDEKSVRFGIRCVELTANAGAPEDALPYTFVVNGQSTYIKGWNWVPIDVMYGLRQPEKLRHLLTLAKAANVNLLRVWGGGLIEREDFYDLCDEFGIMVWQEWIQSSSGIENKPSESPEFIGMMVRQAEEIVKRKRHHASLVLWCGGNELQDESGKPLDDSEPVLSALHTVVERLHPGVNWLPTSPTGPLFMNSLANIERNPSGLHDVHGPWEHQGLIDQYRLYNRGTSLFHSEFGVEGMANKRTIQETISPEKQWPATRDNPVWNHRGSWWINEPLIQQCFGGIHDMDTLVAASQFLQAEGLRYAVEANRRRAFQNSGTIPWQFNESYPNGYCTASVDYFGRPKPAYYAVARAYQPVSITAEFDTQAWQGHHAFECDIYVASSRLDELRGSVRAEVTGVTGQILYLSDCAIRVGPDIATRAQRLEVPLCEWTDEVFFLNLSFRDQHSNVWTNRYVFSKTSNLAPLLSLPPAALKVSARNKAGVHTVLSLHNASDAVALCVQLDDMLPLRGKDYLYFSDNGFHLFPGETKEIQVQTSEESTSARVSVAAWNSQRQVVECD